MTSNELATIEEPSTAVQVADNIRRGVVDRDVVDALKAQIVRGGHPVTDSEFATILIQAEQRGLSPLNGQLWAVVRDEQTKDGYRKVLQPQVGIAGLRLIAERTGRYGGVIRTEWCGEDERWRDVWLSSDPPAAARVTALRDGVEVTGIAYYRESVQTTKAGNPNAMWRKRHTSQLAKCAEAQMFRQAFPEELADVAWTQDDGAPGASRISAEVQRALHPEDHARTLADRRGQELKAAGDEAGLDADGIVALLEEAGLGRPDRRVLGEDTPRAGERFRAMLACIQEHGQATTDVIDAEDVTDHDATDAHDQPEVTTCDEDGAGRPDERPAPIPPPHDGTGNTDPDDHEPTDYPGSAIDAALFGDTDQDHAS